MGDLATDSSNAVPSGLVDAFVLDGRGGGRAVDWPDIAAWTPDDGALWVHLQREAPDAVAWLHDNSGLDPIVVDALLAEETRPRCQPMSDGVLLLLRGVNLNPGADPEDMVSIRIWMESTRIISVRRRRLMAVRSIVGALADGVGPEDPGAFIADAATGLFERMEPVIDDLGDATDALEDELVAGSSDDARGRLAKIRRQVIALRRYMAPQRDAIQRLIATPPTWLGARNVAALRESADRLIRYVEDLDAIRERAAVIQDELGSRQADQLNKRMYLLSVVAAVMLPLGVITGLLGINVGGIPGAESTWGFAVVVIALLALAFGQIILFRRLHWM